MKTKITALLFLIAFISRSQTIQFTQIQKTTPGNLYMAVGTGTAGVMTPTASIPLSKITGTNVLVSTSQGITINGITKTFTSTPTFTTPLSQILGIGNSVGGQDISSTDGDAIMQLTSGSSLSLSNNFGTLSMTNGSMSLQHTSLIDFSATSVTKNGSEIPVFSDFSATSPLIYNGAGTFSIQPASTSQAGALSSIDWNNFNSKLNSVNGTTNRITSSGGVNPTIDISSTFEALLSKIANRIDQNNASTTSAQLATTISDETGTGNIVYNTAPSISSPTITGITTQSTTTYNGAVYQYKSADVASSSTTAIGVGGNYCHITGTTTINSFSVLPAGAVTTTVFDNTLTVTSSTNIILPDATNILTGANDIAMWISEGSGVWRLLDYKIYNNAMIGYQPSFTGFSSNPTGLAYYSLVGKTCTVRFQFTAAGTSNDVVTTVTLPFTSKVISQYAFGNGTDGGSTATMIIRSQTGTNIANVYKFISFTSPLGAWTGSGSKNFAVTLVYEIQ